MTTRFVCLFAVLSLAPLSALAKKPAPADAPPAAKHYDFDDDPVEVELPSAEGMGVDSLVRQSHPSLIRVRTTFVPELVKSSEGL